MPPKNRVLRSIDTPLPVRAGTSQGASTGGGSGGSDVAPPVSSGPGDPTNLQLTTALYRADCNPVSNITATWDAPGEQNPVIAAFYIVQYTKNDPTFAVTNTLEILSADTSTTFGNLDAGETYYVRVAAVLGGYRSNWTAAVSIAVASDTSSSDIFLFLATTSGETPGGVYRQPQSTGVWTLYNNGLPSGVTWGYVAADPSNPDHWLVAAASGVVTAGQLYESGTTALVWRTIDGGASWDACSISVTSPHATTFWSGLDRTIGTTYTYGIEFAATGTGEWVIMATGEALVAGVSVSARLWVIRGFGATGSVTASADDTYRADHGALAVPDNGDAVITGFRGAGENKDHLGYAAAVDTVVTMYSQITTDRVALDRVWATPGAIVGAATTGSTIWGTTDYTTTNLSELIASTTGTSVSSGSAGIYVGGRSSGVALITDLFGTPSVSTVYGSGTAVSTVRVDRRAGAAVAARRGSSSADTYLYDGAAWATVTGPSGVSGAHLTTTALDIVSTLDCSGCPPATHHSNHEIGGCDPIVLDLLSGQVHTDQIADGAVTTAKIADGTIVTADLADDAVTFAKMQNISTDRLIGRDTTGTGDPEQLTVSGGLEFTGSGGVQRSALTGDVTASAGSNSTTIPNDTVTYAKMQNVSATDKLLGRVSSGAGDVEEVTFSDFGQSLLSDTTRTANTVLAGPTSGGAAAPAFRALVAADVPQLTVTDTAGGPAVEIPHQYGWSASGALTIATFGVPVYHVRSDETVVGWYAYVATAPSGSAATFDIEYSTNNGSSWATIFSSAPSISAAANYGTSTSGISVSTLSKGHLLRAKCTAANSAADLTLHLLTKMR